MKADERIRIALCGDVMTGRGIDQALPSPGDPAVYEPYVRDAREYLALAQRRNGPLELPVSFGYIWGDALEELRRRRPHARIVNLETSITTAADAWPGKGINYRMHPNNTPCLTAGGIDMCALANNHVLDWGYDGLAETLRSLSRAGIAYAGAGATLHQARRPASRKPAGSSRRILLFSCGFQSSGIPQQWAATDSRPGVFLLPHPAEIDSRLLHEWIGRRRGSDDIVIVSIHWGGNWGYAIPRAHRRFAHMLVDELGVDIVHGHSSHHPRRMELHRGGPILYGCGDCINDYEGIGGYEEYHPDLAILYFVTLDGREKNPVDVERVPFRRSRLTLHRAPDDRLPPEIDEAP